ncbi:MAG: ribosomal subunit interface protein [Legionellales bacterium]|nr:ribosomal subunit interface protein [Legionellales bacterium]|tara:strand:+ start:3446 stop:3757 length:312 start_codon:yes stop_codon:yes gene_type:complete
MQLNITGIHTEVTSALKEYVTSKFERIEKHFPHITNAHVTLTVENKGHHKAEAHVHVSQGELHASADEQDMYAAIDLMIDKLDRQIVKHKEILEKRAHGQDEH